MENTNRFEQADVWGLEEIIRDWFVDETSALACGDWERGAIMEILPRGRAMLTGARYPEPFTGLREVRIPGQKHHLHLDLGKIDQVIYAVMPSVCYGYRPSFEVHFVREAHVSPSFMVMVSAPYRRGRPNRRALVGYFRRLLVHLERFPELVRFRMELPPVALSFDVWAEVLACFYEAGGKDVAAISIARRLEQMTVPEVASA
jgi:hypothetical protein